MRGLHRAAFRRVVAVLYTAGAVFHALRLTFRPHWADMPFLADWILVVAAPYGAAGLIRFAREVVYRGRWEVVTHWLMVVHLGVTAALHAWIIGVGSHEILAVFPVSYSGIGIAYFGFFAWRAWTMRLGTRPAG